MVVCRRGGGGGNDEGCLVVVRVIRLLLLLLMHYILEEERFFDFGVQRRQKGRGEKGRLEWKEAVPGWKKRMKRMVKVKEVVVMYVA